MFVDYAGCEVEADDIFCALWFCGMWTLRESGLGEENGGRGKERMWEDGEVGCLRSGWLRDG